MVNPNFPVISAQLGTANPDFGTTAANYTEIVKRLIGQWGTGRGRQYELDQMQAGTWRGMWRNEDGAMDPGNAGSAYAGMLLPYRPFTVQAQWPPTRNLLTADQATGGEGTPLAVGTSGSSVGVSWTGISTSSGPSVTASASAYQGTQVWQDTMSSATLAGRLPFLIQVPIEPGAAWSLTVQARCITTGQSPTVYAAITWFNAAGGTVSQAAGTTQTLTGGTAPAWTACTVSAVAPATAVYAQIGIALAANLSANTAFQADGLQFERAASASAFVAPGTWYPMWSGLVERYPQVWKYKGGYGTVGATAVDPLAPLANVTLSDPLTATIFNTSGGQSPTFAYMLGDPSGSSAFADAAGNYGAAPILASKFGSGTVTSGTTQTATSTSGKFIGSAQTVTTFGGPTAAGSNLYGVPMSAISLSGSVGSTLGPHAGVPGPGGGTGLGFTRMIAFRCTQAPSTASALWYSLSGITSSQSFVGLFLFPGGNVSAYIDDATHGAGTFVGTYDVGNWHLAWIGVSANGASWLAGVDASASINTTTGSPYSFPSGFSLDLLGAAAYSGAATPDFANLNYNYVGDMAMAVEWPFFMTAGDTVNVYNAWRSAFSGDASGQRYIRILNWAGYTGPTAIDIGASQSLGPATDITGKSALAALQAVIDTENGQHFVDAGGTLRFYARTRRYLATKPTVTFGESTGTGEFPYEDLQTDFDPTRIANVIQITQTTTSQVFTAIDTPSQPSYGQRTLSRNNQSTSALECQDAANYLLSRYKSPRTRLKSLRLHPGANAALWPPLLALELGARIRAMRRPPPPAAAIQIDGFVEQINWTVTDKADALVDLQVSPADLSPYGVFTSVHAALLNPASSGANTIVLKPLADAATNPAAANLTGGQQLVLDIGLGAQETVTIATGGVQATSPGYTSVTITLTANLGQNHSANAVVCEPMPSGVTDPTVYDSAAVFDSVQFTY